jgi:hypothetical protein
VFLEMGGFHEGYRRPCIEDIELGFRLRRAGYHIRLDRSIQATHLKDWSLRNLVRTDIWQRGVPWMALMLRDRSLVKDLNLSRESRASVALACVLLAALVAVSLVTKGGAGLALLCLLGGGAAGILLHDRLHPRARTPAMGLSVLIAAGAAGACLVAFPTGAAPLALLAPIVLLNRRFYHFFIEKRGGEFAFGVLPLHLLYLLYSATCIPIGIAAHAWDRFRARRWSVGPGVIPNRSLPSAEPEALAVPWTRAS